MKSTLAWAVIVVAGMSSVGCGPESNPGNDTGGTGGTTGGDGGTGGTTAGNGGTGGTTAGNGGTGGTTAGNGGTGGTTAGNGGSMSGAGGATGGAGAGGGGGGAGQGGTSGTAGSGGVVEAFGVVQYGTLLHYPMPGRNAQLANAAFYRERAATTGPVCQRTAVGACFVSDCRAMTDPPEPEPPPPAPTAGVITIRSTGEFTADLTPDANGIYTGGAMGNLLGEESVTVTAAGGEVPNFTHTMTYPLLMLLTQPEFDDVQTEYVASRTEDLVLAWDRGTPSLSLGVQAYGGAASLGCAFPGEGGTGTISSELLAILDSGTELILLGVETEVVTAGDYDVSVSSAGAVMTPDRTRRAKIVLE
jgi:hypothetical protein